MRWLTEPLAVRTLEAAAQRFCPLSEQLVPGVFAVLLDVTCLLYTSDAADE